MTCLTQLSFITLGFRKWNDYNVSDLFCNKYFQCTSQTNGNTVSTQQIQSPGEKENVTKVTVEMAMAGQGDKMLQGTPTMKSA